jgi:hypothetical protein
MKSSQQTMPGLRGLDIRCQFALAKITGHIYGVESDQYSKLLFDSLIAAQTQGSHDFEVGLSTIPPLFSSEIALVGAWKDGFFQKFKDSYISGLAKE